MKTLTNIQKIHRGCLVLMLCACVFACGPASAEKSERDVYSYNSHGAMGFITALAHITAVDPSYKEPLDKAVNWLIEELTEKIDNGKITWRNTAGSDLKDARLNRVQGGEPQCEPFGALYVQFEEKRFADLAESGCLAMIKSIGKSKKTPWGPGYAIRTMAGVPDLSGAIWGSGRYLNQMTTIHHIRPNPKIKETAYALVRTYRQHGVLEGEAAESMISWISMDAKKKNNIPIETGRCYGQAGSAEALLGFHKEFESFRFPDKVSALDLANQSLRFLAKNAQVDEERFFWKHGSKKKKDNQSPGFGGGAAGIGHAFLLGMEANQKAGNEEMAALCRKYAIGAAHYITDTMQNPSRNYNEGMMAPGLCGGVAGAALFLRLMDERFGKDDPKLSKELRTAGQNIGKRLNKKKLQLKEGIAWSTSTKQYGANSVNLALDYGQTGQIYVLVELYEWLKDETYLKMARQATDFMLSVAVEEPHGLKIPWITRLK